MHCMTFRSTKSVNVPSVNLRDTVICLDVAMSYNLYFILIIQRERSYACQIHASDMTALRFCLLGVEG